jgi:hypothetical protein
VKNQYETTTWTRDLYALKTTVILLSEEAVDDDLNVKKFPFLPPGKKKKTVKAFML